jgi:hypothetical protein
MDIQDCPVEFGPKGLPGHLRQAFQKRDSKTEIRGQEHGDLVRRRSEGRLRGSIEAGHPHHKGPALRRRLPSVIGKRLHPGQL